MLPVMACGDHSGLGPLGCVPCWACLSISALPEALCLAISGELCMYVCVCVCVCVYGGVCVCGVYILCVLLSLPPWHTTVTVTDRDRCRAGVMRKTSATRPMGHSENMTAAPPTLEIPPLRLSGTPRPRAPMPPCCDGTAMRALNPVLFPPPLMPARLSRARPPPPWQQSSAGVPACQGRLDPTSLTPRT